MSNKQKRSVGGVRMVRRGWRSTTMPIGFKSPKFIKPKQLAMKEGETTEQWQQRLRDLGIIGDIKRSEPVDA